MAPVSIEAGYKINRAPIQTSQKMDALDSTKVWIAPFHSEADMRRTKQMSDGFRFSPSRITLQSKVIQDIDSLSRETLLSVLETVSQKKSSYSVLNNGTPSLEESVSSTVNNLHTDTTKEEVSHTKDKYHPKKFNQDRKVAWMQQEKKTHEKPKLEMSYQREVPHHGEQKNSMCIYDAIVRSKYCQKRTNICSKLTNQNTSFQSTQDVDPIGSLRIKSIAERRKACHSAPTQIFRRSNIHSKTIQENGEQVGINPTITPCTLQRRFVAEVDEQSTPDDLYPLSRLSNQVHKLSTEQEKKYPSDVDDQPFDMGIQIALTTSISPSLSTKGTSKDTQHTPLFQKSEVLFDMEKSDSGLDLYEEESNISVPKENVVRGSNAYSLRMYEMSEEKLESNHYFYDKTDTVSLWKVPDKNEYDLTSEFQHPRSRTPDQGNENVASYEQSVAMKQHESRSFTKIDAENIYSYTSHDTNGKGEVRTHNDASSTSFVTTLRPKSSKSLQIIKTQTSSEHYQEFLSSKPNQAADEVTVSETRSKGKVKSSKKKAKEQDQSKKLDHSINSSRKHSKPVNSLNNTVSSYSKKKERKKRENTNEKQDSGDVDGENEHDPISELNSEVLFLEREDTMEKKRAIVEERKRKRAEDAERRRLEVENRRKQKRIEELAAAEKNDQLKRLQEEEKKAADAMEVELIKREKQRLLKEKEELLLAEQKEKQRKEEKRRKAAEEIAREKAEIKKLNEERFHRERLLQSAERKLQMLKEQKEKEENLRRQNEMKKKLERHNASQEEERNNKIREKLEKEERERYDEEMRQAMIELEKRRKLALHRRQCNLERRKTLSDIKQNQLITRPKSFSYFVQIPRDVWELPIGWQKRPKYRAGGQKARLNK